MYPLQNRIQTYEWGSHTALAELLGLGGRSADPQAELWMGAHPLGASRALVGGQWMSLADVIARDPHAEIGPRVAERFGRRLPFMLKVLAIEKPLSLQAHPTPAQAEAGFLAEEAAGIARDAPHRNYRDPCHKPELVCAVTPFETLCGFRPIAETLRLLDELAIAELEPMLQGLRARPGAGELRILFTRLMECDAAERTRLVLATLDACARLVARRREVSPVYHWVLRVGARYPQDIGVVTMLLLNWVRLEPHEGIYVAPGSLHAYLSGVGIEIQASSDNVLRGGLTPKHIDIPELVRILDFEPRPVQKIAPCSRGAEIVYEAPVPDFRLSRIDLGAGAEWRTADRRGPEIVLAGAGQLHAHYVDGATPVPLGRGQSVFVPAHAGPYALAGEGHAYRATLGD